ncbi:fused MFS/spermidine synthase [soil metagenome]
MIRRVAVAMFLGSAVMFALEPTLARMILPHAGGGPSVWTACLVFFQVALLVGYVAAHALTTRLGARAQIIVLIGVLLVGIAFMPVALHDDATSSAVGVLRALAVAAGVPFVALAMISPTLQRWQHATVADREPYVLYAASNAGSLIGLVLVPLLEPFLGLRAMARGATAVYVALVVVVATAAARRLRAPPEPRVAEDAVAPVLAARWALLAFVPSAYLAAVTTHVTIEFAPMPLLWVIPLALYIVTFIVAFAGGGRVLLPARLCAHVVPFTTAIIVFLLVTRANAFPFSLGALHFGAFGVAALACHTELARLRPAPTQATAFYVAMAAGGALGSVFVAVLAPLLFTQYLEYPLLVLCAIAITPPRAVTAPSAPDRRRDVLFALVIGAIAFGSSVAARSTRGLLAALVFPGVALAVALVGFRHRRRYALGLAFIVGIAGVYADDGRTLYRERDFFGTLRVARDPNDQLTVLVHGTTIHGKQSLDPTKRREPLSYYARSGPAGDVFALAHREHLTNVIVVGLGAGTLAAYALAGERWAFIEIDPAVIRLAQNPKYFTFLSDAFPGGSDVREGDARVVLRSLAPQGGLLIVDAFSGDAIPTHLLTLEAGRLYAEHASVVAFHVSNRHANLVPIVGRMARDLGFYATERDDIIVDDEDAAMGKSASDWVVMASSRAALSGLGSDWDAVDPDGKPAWTDDRTSVITILR